jgi:hypothetical protein
MTNGDHFREVSLNIRLWCLLKVHMESEIIKKVDGYVAFGFR